MMNMKRIFRYAMLVWMMLISNAFAQRTLVISYDDNAVDLVEPPNYGILGEGQANSGFDLPGFAEWDIPLGAYSDVTSPWGLFDTAGGAQEWLEETDFHDRPPEERRLDGSVAGWNYPMAELSDRISRFSGSLAPDSSSFTASFRIATIPSAPTLGLAAWSIGVLLIKPRRRTV